MKKKTFHSQLILSYLLVMFLVFSTIFAILLATVLQWNRRTLKTELDTSAKLVSTQFGSILENMTFVSVHTLSHVETVDAMSLLATGSLKESDELEAYRTVQSALINYSIVSSIYRMTYFNEEGYVIQSEQYNLLYDRNARLDESFWEQIDWLDAVQHNHGHAVLLPVQQQLLHEDPAETLMLVRAVRNSRGIVGYLIVEVTLEDISDVLNYDTSNDVALVITATDGTLIYASDSLPEEVSKKITAGSTVDWKDLGYLSASTEDTELKTRVTMVAPVSSLWRDSLKTLAIYMIEGFMVLAVAVVAILLLSKRMTRPLTELSHRMEKTDLNNLSDHPDTSTQYRYAEIESLYTSFASMQDRLHMMIDREIAWKTLQAEQQLQILQTQINPHFMYNTLNMIGIMGYESGNLKIVEACRDFSNLLRYSISDKNARVSTIGSEIENVCSYLSLMQMRFGKSCSYEIVEDPGVATVRIPRLSLQPLIENVFKHGYTGNTAAVDIQIRTAGSHDYWEIEISDNGCGADDARIEQLKRQIQRYLADSDIGEAKVNHTSIGLKNTILRMHLFYNGDFSWNIKNANPGFRILLHGPRKEEPV